MYCAGDLCWMEVYHVEADELLTSEAIYRASFRFGKEENWQGVGIIALHQIG